MTVRILRGDCRDMLRTLEPESVHMCVTSPPYWGLRDYGIPPSIWGGDPACAHEWGPEGRKGGGSHTHTTGTGQNGKKQIEAHEAISSASTGNFCSCGAWRGCLGLEPTPELFVAHMVEVFQEVRRVLRPDGTLWLNLGDSYATGAGKAASPGGGAQGERFLESGPSGYRGTHDISGKHAANTSIPSFQPNRMPIVGLKPKDLVGIPWRVAFALQADGWYLRQDIIWHKPNPMPESVRDRCTKAHEYIFLMSKSPRYYYDFDAIKEAAGEDPGPGVGGWATGADHSAVAHNVVGAPPAHGDTHKRKERRTAGKHAEMPKQSPGFRMVENVARARETGANHDNPFGITRNKRSVWTVTTKPFADAHFATFPPDLIEPCILAGSPRGGVVLDPFAGAGTTGLVADRHGRDAVLIELNPDYADMAERRITGDAPLFTEVSP